ncbi:thiol-disulfide oxidoreductase DCC family protein [Zavarzinella formosa]|uniref:thiol-disulfide oxidoreductase DCC family protein n=1 Tax=Zavarzinella formosa TaxID=360055 RepID=UPI0002F943C3|nr:DUF393 domain-containing protein [Zavarzinella formosa]
MEMITVAESVPKGVVLFDGDCAFCQKSVALLKKLDWFHRLGYHNCRDLAGIPENSANLRPEKMLEEMHLLTPDRQRAYSGFRAVRWIFGRLPLGWLALPLMYVPGIPQLGQKIYLWIARRRFQIVPCHNGICTIPPKRS